MPANSISASVCGIDDPADDPAASVHRWVMYMLYLKLLLLFLIWQMNTSLHICSFIPNEQNLRYTNPFLIYLKKQIHSFLFFI